MSTWQTNLYWAMVWIINTLCSRRRLSITGTSIFCKAKGEKIAEGCVFIISNNHCLKYQLSDTGNYTIVIEVKVSVDKIKCTGKDTDPFTEGQRNSLPPKDAETPTSGLPQPGVCQQIMLQEKQVCKVKQGPNIHNMCFADSRPASVYCHLLNIHCDILGVLQEGIFQLSFTQKKFTCVP